MQEFILGWRDVVRVFGSSVRPHRRLLEKATQATHGLLACNAVPRGHVAMNSLDGDHAEERLIRSALWQDQIIEAIRTWKPSQRQILTILILNRAPCSHCAHLLAGKLHDLRTKCGDALSPHRFVLASLGYYQGQNFMNGKQSPHTQSKLVAGKTERSFSKEVTTDKGMRALEGAGWNLRVTEFGFGPTARGDELLTFLSRM